MQKINMDIEEIGLDVVKSTAVLEAQTNEVALALDDFVDRHDDIRSWIVTAIKTLLTILK